MSSKQEFSLAPNSNLWYARDPAGQQDISRAERAKSDDGTPRTYLAWSIISFLCCCWLFGIFAILKSRDVSRYVSEGKLILAKDASVRARNLNIVATIGGLLGLGLMVAWYFVYLPNLYQL